MGSVGLRIKRNKFTIEMVRVINVQMVLENIGLIKRMKYCSVINVKRMGL